MKNRAVADLINLAVSNDVFQKKLNLICGSSVAPLDSVKKIKHVDDVLKLLHSFPDCAGYSTNRRGQAILSLADENGVQDILYFMLKPSIPDLVPETPVSGSTRQYTIQDFRSPLLRVVIEAKRTRSKSHGRSIKAEINDDVGNYKNDLFCNYLIFFIYDPETHIESISGLQTAIEGEHSHNGRMLRVHCVVQR